MGSVPVAGLARLAVLLLALAPVSIFACESAQLEAVLRDAYPQARQAENGGFVLADGESSFVVSEVACKRWPASPGRLLLAVPLWTSKDPIGLSTGDMDVIVANSEPISVRARHREPGRIDSDAWYFNGVSLDTARYRLTGPVNAFGIRVAFRGSSRVNPADETSLTLYALHEDTLEPVLQQLVVGRSAGEWDGRCSGEWAQLQRTVAVEPNTASGWADLLVRSHASRSTSQEVDSECVDSETPSPSALDRIHFDGQSYPIPARLADWQPWSKGDE